MTAQRTGKPESQKSVMRFLNPVQAVVLTIPLIVAGADSGRSGMAAVEVDDLPSRAQISRLLAAAGDDVGRADLLDAFDNLPSIACPALSLHSEEGAPAWRENAVRAMALVGCDRYADYRSFLRDRNAWVVDALLEAFEQQRIAEAIPFLINRLSDPRRIVSAGGVWTLGERSHRALRAVSCQSLHYNPDSSREDRALSLTAWKAWYDEHRDEPREEWLDAGLARARVYISSDRKSLRLEGLRLLLLIGPEAIEELRAAFHREPDDLRADFSCRPDRPLFTDDQVPCTLEVVNTSAQPIALLPGRVKLRVRRLPDGVRPDRRDESGGRAGDDPPEKEDPSDPRRPGATTFGALIGDVVDLAPGEALRRAVRIGPVSSSGVYEVRATLVDLAAPMLGTGGEAGSIAIAAASELRFGP